MAIDRQKYIDESWKESVDNEKSTAQPADPPRESDVEPDRSTPSQPTPDRDRKPSSEKAGERPQPHQSRREESQALEIDFVNYISGLAYQAMVFLGEIPNPINHQTEINLKQSKFMIDTLILLREKTQNNLTSEEENLLNASIYELQVKFVEHSQQQKMNQR